MWDHVRGRGLVMVRRRVIDLCRRVVSGCPA
ncbi:hypothetical protein Ae168Ps1_1108c [Pseudonocardia sp. Ae168_Ps1]|nr:hypothetical protein Ae168Ps1_1108c [Pseudonocardia sp. Ae168_Ps1]